MRRLLLAGLVSACALAAQPKSGAGSIVGHVFNSLTSEPLRKATVRLTSPNVQLVDETDAAGMFQFTGLPPGIYRLSASRVGFLDHAARLPISLGSSEDVADSEIRLPPQGSIVGLILDEDNDPLSGTHALIFKQVYRGGRKRWQPLNTGAIANDAGEYRFSKLTPGRYIIRAQNDQCLLPNNRFGDRPKTVCTPVYYPAASTQEEALSVQVGAGTEVRDIDIHLSKRPAPPLFHVSGKVVGVPADSPTVIVFVSGGSDLECGGQDDARPPDYAFDLKSRSGQCTISANVFEGNSEAYARQSISVGADVAGVVVTMVPPTTVTGRISVEETSGQVKLQGVSVFLQDLSYQVNNQVALSDATGKFAFAKSVRSGHYSLNINTQTLPDGCFLRDVKLDGQEISTDDFELQGSAQLEVVLSNTAGKIKGSVSNADGTAFPISKVTLIPTDGKSRPVEESPDDKGNYQFAGLRPGKYDLYAWEEVDDDLWQDPEFRQKYENRSTEVTVGPSDTRNVQLRVILLEEMK